MSSYLIFETSLSLTVDEDIETVRERITKPSDGGLAELHAMGMKVFVQVSEIKYAEEVKESGSSKRLGFDTSTAS